MQWLDGECHKTASVRWDVVRLHTITVTASEMQRIWKCLARILEDE